ncbi:hypothetical protein CPB83DRAFT_141286 [Crepidotus variabilis]|uniref:Uncharacterized protein n=1 Tax=Crepidotus variabilis TaxID=179855 RepID=A0A9P6E450_9AGAR|nr:hypothetical protein CPB83DRAFT_141286 [Crepidotus variabilis]
MHTTYIYVGHIDITVWKRNASLRTKTSQYLSFRNLRPTHERSSNSCSTFMSNSLVTFHPTPSIFNIHPPLRRQSESTDLHKSSTREPISSKVYIPCSTINVYPVWRGELTNFRGSNWKFEYHHILKPQDPRQSPADDHRVTSRSAWADPASYALICRWRWIWAQYRSNLR